MLDRECCAAKVVISGHVWRVYNEGKVGKDSLKNTSMNRFPAHRVHHSESIIAVVGFSLCSLDTLKHLLARR